jgi:nucleotide-binding universal stress UspA family protein
MREDLTAMRQFTNILFSPLGHDHNPAALRRVVELAEQNRARLTLVGVVPEPPWHQRLIHRHEFFGEVKEAERHGRRGQIEGWAERCGTPEAEVLVEIGRPASALVGRVLAADHDLVVVTTDEDHEDHGTINHLLRDCPCPVWVIRPTRARIQRVLVAVDPEPDQVELNQRCLELGAGLVERYGGELHLAHAWELYGESTMRSSPYLQVPEAEIEALLEEARSASLSALQELMASSTVADAPWREHLHNGPPVEVIEALAAKLRINVLVMGTVARSGIAGMVMGNTAERVLDEVRCSVIAVKPPGFVSPSAARRP